MSISFSSSSLVKTLVFVIFFVILTIFSNASNAREFDNEIISAGENSHHHHTDLASIATGNFYNDIKNKDWAIKMAIHCAASNPTLQRKDDTLTLASSFYHTNYEPTWSCGFEEKLGERGDGGKWICDPHRISKQKQKCLAYSIGSNNQYDFEEAINRHVPGCEIHTFDPSIIKSEITAPKIVSFHNFAITSNSGDANSNNNNSNNSNNIEQSKRSLRNTVPPSEWNSKNMGQVIDLLKHENRVIDIFKIDCEACEYDFFSDALWNVLREKNVIIRQIQIEIHAPTGVDVFNLKMKDKDKMIKLFDMFANNGYVMFHKEPNNLGKRPGNCIEASFLKIADSKPTCI